MMPTYDPATFFALVWRKRELVVMQLCDVVNFREGVLRIAQSKSALKRWRRSFEFHKRKAANGRKEVSNGNCNS
jgi:hypothetical protein